MASLLLYLICVGFGIIFAFLYVDYGIAIFTGIAVLFPTAAALLAIIPCIFLKISIEGEEKQVHKGEDFQVRFRLKNPTILPITYGIIHLSYRYEALGRWNKRKMTFQLKGRDESICDLTLKSEYCGAVEVRVRRVESRDLFRIFPLTKWVKKAWRQVVFPKLDELDLQVENTENFYQEEYDEFYEDHPGNDPSEVFEVRDYKEGDKLQRIHWKLSSKKDKLMVKEFSDPIVINAVIIFDNYCTEKKMKFVQEWSNLLEKTVQASYTLLQQEVNHYVYWFCEEDLKINKKEVRTVEDLNACIKELMQSKPYENAGYYINCLYYSENIENYKNIFYVGTENNAQFAKHGMQVKVVE